MTILTFMLQGLAGFVITVGFAVLFRVPRNLLIRCGLVGTAGHLLRYSLRSLGVSNEVATFAGAMLIGLAGYWTARQIHYPRLVFTLTGVISMVPGTAAYEAVMYISTGKLNDGIQSGVRVALLTGAIAMGLSLARIVVEVSDELTGD
jgi:uncharacterized membrane protein YjjB (DUF3815 family)